MAKDWKRPAQPAGGGVAAADAPPAEPTATEPPPEAQSAEPQREAAAEAPATTKPAEGEKRRRIDSSRDARPAYEQSRDARRREGAPDRRARNDAADETIDRLITVMQQQAQTLDRAVSSMASTLEAVLGRVGDPQKDQSMEAMRKQIAEFQAQIAALKSGAETGMKSLVGDQEGAEKPAEVKAAAPAAETPAEAPGPYDTLTTDELRQKKADLEEGLGTASEDQAEALSADLNLVLAELAARKAGKKPGAKPAPPVVEPAGAAAPAAEAPAVEVVAAAAPAAPVETAPAPKDAEPEIDQTLVDVYLEMNDEQLVGAIARLEAALPKSAGLVKQRSLQKLAAIKEAVRRKAAGPDAAAKPEAEKDPYENSSDQDLITVIREARKTLNRLGKKPKLTGPADNIYDLQIQRAYKVFEGRGKGPKTVEALVNAPEGPVTGVLGAPEEASGPEVVVSVPEGDVGPEGPTDLSTSVPVDAGPEIFTRPYQRPKIVMPPPPDLSEEISPDAQVFEAKPIDLPPDDNLPVPSAEDQKAFMDRIGAVDADELGRMINQLTREVARFKKAAKSGAPIVRNPGFLADLGGSVWELTQAKAAMNKLPPIELPDSAIEEATEEDTFPELEESDLEPLPDEPGPTRAKRLADRVNGTAVVSRENPFAPAIKSRAPEPDDTLTETFETPAEGWTRESPPPPPSPEDQAAFKAEIAALSPDALTKKISSLAQEVARYDKAVKTVAPGLLEAPITALGEAKWELAEASARMEQIEKAKRERQAQIEKILEQRVFTPDQRQASLEAIASGVEQPQTVAEMQTLIGESGPLLAWIKSFESATPDQYARVFAELDPPIDLPEGTTAEEIKPLVEQTKALADAVLKAEARAQERLAELQQKTQSAG